jgi:hypothetical protein
LNSNDIDDQFESVLSNLGDNKEYIRPRWKSQYLVNYLLELGSNFMVLERDYVDRDYYDDFSNYYSKCYSLYGPRCHRVHFFKDFNHELFSEVIEGKNHKYTKKMQNDYLGYIVVRPLPEAVIGRTSLKNIDGTIQDIEVQDTNTTRIIRCVETRTANLFGIDLSVEALPYIEQDLCTGQCATSALWSLLQYTADMYNHKRPTRYQITNFATQFFKRNRTFPTSGGLSIFQICQAIREYGLEPEVFDYLSYLPRATKEFHNNYINHVEVNQYLLGLLYAFLREGFPLLIGEYFIEDCDSHAVVAVGYELDDYPNESISYDINLDETNNDTYYLTLKGSKISKIYVHDDFWGPNMGMNIRVLQEVDKPDNAVCYFESDDWNRIGKNTILPYSVIAPVPPLMRVPYSVIIENLFHFDYIIYIFGVISGTYLEWEVYLTTINRYRSQMLKDQDLTGDKKSSVLANAPKYIWICKGYLNNKLVIELLADTSDMALSCQFFKINYYNDKIRRQIIDLLNNEDAQDEMERTPNLKSYLTGQKFVDLINNGLLYQLNP